MQRSTLKMLGIVGLFSIAMGFLESAVVIYIREIYYPEGFNFPLKMMSMHIAATELFREIATLIMLVLIGILAGRTKTEKFGYFIYSFAIWDILYYIFLKLMVDWPESLLTWDILFLLPTTWVGPVITPVALALLMVVFAFFISYFTDKISNLVILKLEWILIIAGSITTIVSFTLEYTEFILQKYSFLQVLNMDKKFLQYAIQYVPHNFPWWIFIAGFLLIAIGIVLFYFRNLKLTLTKTISER